MRATILHVEGIRRCDLVLERIRTLNFNSMLQQLANNVKNVLINFEIHFCF